MPKQGPPHDIESEQAILDAIMLEPKLIKQIDLTIEDFYLKKHQKIYQCILELSEDGIDADFVSVNSKIKARNFENEVETTYLFGLGDAFPSAVTKQWKSYVTIIKKKSAARELIALSERMNRFANNGLNDLPSKIDQTVSQLIDIRAKASGDKKGLTAQIEDLVATTKGNFTTTDVYAELGLTTRDNKKKAVMALRRLVDAGKLTPCGDKQGCYRVIEECTEMHWQDAEVNNFYEIRWPFELEKLVRIFPKNIIVIAGEKNAGKSAFLYNVIRLNQDRHKINYFNSESSPEEMKLRLTSFEGMPTSAWHFKTYPRSSNFPEAIHPDRLNIIDYYEFNDDKFYQIGSEIRKIHDRLRKGICIIALQKKKGQEFGRGGDFSREKARLYVTLERGLLTIKDGKIWASDINPNGFEIKFKLVGGWKFLETGGSSWDLV